MDISVLLAIVFFLASAVLSIVLTLVLVKKKQPIWAYKTTRIIGLGTNAPPELKIQFNDTLVQEVNSTDLIFFNKGNETINKSDITEPITIHFRESNILRAPTIEQQGKKANKFNVELLKNHSAIELDFSYLDKGDGALLNILHTSCKKLEIEGNIKEVTTFKNIGEFNKKEPRPRGLIVLIILIIGILISVFWALSQFEPISSLIQPFPFTRAALAGLTGMFAGIIASAVVNWLPNYISYKKYPEWSRRKNNFKTYRPINVIGDIRAKCNGCKKTFKIPPDEYKTMFYKGKAFCPFCGKSNITYNYDEI